MVGSSNYLVKRLYLGLVALFITTIIVSTIVFLIPVDPARLSFGQMMDPVTLEETKKNYGLDQTLPNQILKYLRDISPLAIVHSERAPIEEYRGVSISLGGGYLAFLKVPYLRKSYQSGRKVSSILKEVWPLTFVLGLSSLVIGLVFGIGLGLLASQFYQTWIDRLLVSVSVMGYSIPSYVSALIFSILFGYFLHDYTGLPVQGSLRQLDVQGNSFWSWKHLVLPAIALGIRPIAVIMQMTRAAILQVDREPFIRTALSKGLSRKNTLMIHTLPNAANPVISTITSWLAALLAGAFFVESIFNYHGVGLTTVEALLKFDIPLLLGCILSVGVVLILVNILTDVLYVLFDPRMKLE